MKKSAFTMLELVFVIVVIGILAAAILPRMDRDTLYEATEQVLGHIKYTQHLAMTDNVYDDTNQNWFQNRWKISFSADQYSVSKSTTGNFAANDLYGVDALSQNNIDGTSIDDYDLNDKYTISVTPDATLSFDALGRPYIGDAPTSAVSDLRKTNFILTLTAANGDTATITITPETGYSFITYN